MKKELKNLFYSMKKKWKSFFHYVPYLGLNSNHFSNVLLKSGFYLIAK